MRLNVFLNNQKVYEGKTAHMDGRIAINAYPVLLALKGKAFIDTERNVARLVMHSREVIVENNSMSAVCISYIPAVVVEETEDKYDLANYMNVPYHSVTLNKSQVLLKSEPVIEEGNIWLPVDFIEEAFTVQVVIKDDAVEIIRNETLEEAYADFEDAGFLGEFVPFYRGQQLQGHLLTKPQGLVQIPGCFLESSFPYKKRPYPREIPFVDKFSVVRFCGGYNKGWKGSRGSEDDLAYRDEKGGVGYRWELLKKRLSPYIENGYTELVLSLDNVPWDLASFEAEGFYGQPAPPKDYGEWDRFIEELCHKLVEFYGFEMVNRWAFRMGTEPNGAVRGGRHTFNGNHEDYLKWYLHTSEAVRKVLPGAKFGPGEFMGPIVDGGPREPGVNYVKLAQDSEETGVAIDFLANSSHSIPHYRNGRLAGGADPKFRGAWSIKSFENIMKVDEKLRKVPKYVFQFGPLLHYDVFADKNIKTLEPGGRGAAWRFFALLEMKQKLTGLCGIWHWGATENLYDISGGEVNQAFGNAKGNQGSKLLMMGNGWLYSILDHMEGAEAYLLDLPDFSDGTMCRILCAKKERQVHIVAATYHVDRSIHDKKKLKIKLPESLCIHGKVKAGIIGLSEENSLYGRIKQDLDGKGLLKKDYKYNDILAHIHIMAEEGGVDFLIENYAKYEELQKELLTLKPFEGLRCEGKELLVEFEIETSSVVAIRMEAADI